MEANRAKEFVSVTVRHGVTGGVRERERRRRRREEEEEGTEGGRETV